MKNLCSLLGPAAFAALAVSGGAGCGDGNGNGDVGHDGVVDSDTGGDADADVPGEADAEADVEVDAAADADGDHDADGEVSSGVPTLTALEVRRIVPGIYRLLMTGTDADGDLSHPQVTFVDAGGADVPQAGRIDIDAEFAWPYSGEVSFEMGTELWVFELISGDDATPAGATGYRVELWDEAGHESNSLTAHWSDMVQRGAGEACSPVGFDDMCSGDLVCTGSPAVCTSRDTVASSVCAGALRALTSGVQVTVSGPRHFGGNVFQGSCSPTFDVVWPGPEEVFTLVVATRSHVVLTTSLPGSLGADTVLYVRSACADPASEIACIDDNSDTDVLSTIDVPSVEPGTYYVFADAYAYSYDFDILVTVTPI